MDAISEQRLSQVYPQLAAKIRQLSDAMAGLGVTIRVTQGLRTYSEQAALYAQGRTQPGPVVTEAAAGYSWHNFGLAIDIVPMTPAPDWNIQHPAWTQLVEQGANLGLVSGAQFRTFPDWPHFQLTGVLPLSPDDQTRQLFATGGIVAVWAATGLGDTA